MMVVGQKYGITCGDVDYDCISMDEHIWLENPWLAF